jgi:hypothetical protein
MMTRRAIGILAIAILTASMAVAYGQEMTTKEKIVGSWKLLSFFDQSVDTGKTTDVFGENPRGYLIVTADGRIALIHVANSRKAPSGPAPTDAEAAALQKTMLAYVGRYEVDPKPTEAGLAMTIRSEVASNPRLEGLDRKFVVRTEGDKLIFKTTPPARNPTTGEMTTRNVILERDH